VRATAEVDGSIALAGGGVFLANRIDDAFAVVDVGAPGVAVSHENRTIGVTDSSGRLLVPYLLSWQRNAIQIDPKNLPIDADVRSTRNVVVPADSSGVVVKFGVTRHSDAALVVLVEQDGKPVPVTSQGKLEKGGETFVVGYDGQAYVQGLSSQNRVVIRRPDNSTCRAEFAYTPKPGEQVLIKDVVCR
jgi:outer membrane usher protein